MIDCDIHIDFPFGGGDVLNEVVFTTSLAVLPVVGCGLWIRVRAEDDGLILKVHDIDVLHIVQGTRTKALVWCQDFEESCSLVEHRTGADAYAAAFSLCEYLPGAKLFGKGPEDP